MTFRRNQDVITRQEGDQTLVFHQKTGWICILNASSSFIWDQCEGAVSPREIADRIQQEFDLSGELGDPRHLVDVVEQHLDLMHKGQLLEAVEV